MTDVIALLQRLSSNKAAGTSSHALVPPVDNHSIHAEDAAGLSFEELERRRQFGARLPPPPPRPQQHTPLPPPPASMAKPEQLPPPPPKRANKNRPIEQSSKKAVPRFRDVLQVGNKAAVDPRFASGGLEEPAAKTSDKELWRKRYAFVFDELLPEEKQEAQRALTKVKSSRSKAEIQQQLRAVQSQMQAERDRQKRDDREQKLKATQREARSQGKAPYYLKKSEKRKLELLERYKELSSAGKVDQYLEKRRKRNAAKDHKLVPSTRRTMMDDE